MNNDYKTPVQESGQPENGFQNQTAQNYTEQNGQQGQSRPGQPGGFPQNGYQQPYQQQQYPQQPYYPPAYGQPPYRQPYQPPIPPAPQPGKGLATASLVCSIFSIILFYMGLFSVFGIILGIIAIVTGACAKKKGFVGGMATAGLVMGIIGTVLSCIFFITCLSCIGVIGNASIPEGIYDWDMPDDFDWDWSNYV